MGHIRSVRGRSSIVSAALLSLSTLSQAAPVNTIFAAENSLYGRGYDIGRADGWMDDALHRAISRFQSRTKGLRATGNLDPATLEALGIDAGDRTISGNALANKQAALAALDRATNPGGTGAGSTGGAAAVTATQPMANVEPEPAPTPEPAKTVTTAPEPVIVAKKPEPTPTPGSKPAVNSDPSIKTAPAIAEPDVAVLKTQPEPAKTVTTTHPAADKPVRARSEPSQATTSTAQETGPAEPAAETTVAGAGRQTREVPQKPAAPADTVAANSLNSGGKTVAAASEAPARPAPETTTTDKQQAGPKASGSSGGFFSWLFDLLFGWMT